MLMTLAISQQNLNQNSNTYLSFEFELNSNRIWGFELIRRGRNEVFKLRGCYKAQVSDEIQNRQW
jgi:hypothetical protein